MDHKFTFVDLFAGCGGLSLGMEQAGFTPVFANEIWNVAAETYRRNRDIKEENVFVGDINHSTRTSRREQPAIRFWYNKVNRTKGGNMTREYPAIKACAEWFEANREDLLSKYSGRYLAIADGRVLGDYADQLEGIRAMLGSGRVAGTFIVHQCVPKEDEPRIICHWQMRNPLPL